MSTSALKRRALRPEFIINNILLVALLIMCAYFATKSDVFLSVSNFKVILTNNAVLAVVAAALTLLIISGHVDLSIGSTIGLSGLIAALASLNWGLPDSVAFAAGVAAGSSVGLINGLLCGILRFNPIIVTLGMLAAVRGATLLIEENDVFGLGGLFSTVATGDVLGVPILLLFGAGAFALAAAFIGVTPWGRHIYAIGVNPQAAFLSALPVRALPFALYVVTGTAAGLAGVLLTARLDGASPGSQGLQMEIQVLTIILLGGVAFAGGRGRILGVLTAWVFLGVLQNGLILMNVTPFVQLVASGLALVFAAGLDQFGAYVVPRLEERRRVVEQIAAPRRETGRETVSAEDG